MTSLALGSGFWVLGCALIGIRASARSATGQMISGTGPQPQGTAAIKETTEAGTTVTALRPTGRYEHVMCGFLMWEGPQGRDRQA